MINESSKVVFALLCFVQIANAANYWENRTVNCLTERDEQASCAPVKLEGDVYLNSTRSKLIRSNWACKRELIPEGKVKIDGRLITETTTWALCPLNCAATVKDRLSVTLKQPYTNSKCYVGSTYGYIRTAEDWFMWVAEPCRALLTIWCPFEEPRKP